MKTGLPWLDMGLDLTVGEYLACAVIVMILGGVLALLGWLL